MINILFTCAGRRNYLINYFKEALNGQGQVFASDMSLLAPAMVEADVSIVVPSIYDADYISILKDIVIKHQINAIISLNDLELPILSKHRQEFESLNAKLLISNEEVIDIAFDKKRCFEFLSQHEILSPKTYTDLNEANVALEKGMLKFPLVVKPRWGSASIGIDFPDSKEELALTFELQKIKIQRSILNTISNNDLDNAILIQEKIEGKEYGLDILNDFNGNYIGTFAKEKLSMRSGETDKARTLVNPKFEILGKQISNSLRHYGNLDCDVFEYNGNLYVLELNPRFGGGYPFTHESGVNIAAIYIEWLKGNTNIERLINFKGGFAFAKCDKMIKLN